MAQFFNLPDIQRPILQYLGWPAVSWSKTCHLWIVKQALHDWTYVARESYLYCSPPQAFCCFWQALSCSTELFSWLTRVVDFPYYHKQQHLGEKAWVQG